MHAPKGDSGWDRTLFLLREGYLFITNRRRKFAADVVCTRVLFHKAICVAGEDGARLFYQEDKLQRHGAIPLRVQSTLTGRNAIHTMDDTAHKQERTIFLNLTTPDRVKILADLTAKEWEQAQISWTGRIALFHEAVEVLFRAACAWAGIPLSEKKRVATRKIYWQ